MNLSKYRNLVLIYALFLIITLIILLFSQGTRTDPVIYFIPLGAVGSIMFLILMIALSSIIGAAFVGFVFGPLFLYVHKKILGKKMTYSIQDRPQKEIVKGTFLKLLFPALFALNLCLMFYNNPFIIELFTPPGATQNVSPFNVFFALTPLMIGISTGIFSPFWFLLDGGIVYTNNEKVKDVTDPIELRSVGGWYMYLLKGYAGISVILNYYDFLAQLITNTQSGDLLVYIFWPIMPFLIVILAIPCIIALDVNFEKRRKFIRKWANKFDITALQESQ